MPHPTEIDEEKLIEEVYQAASIGDTVEIDLKDPHGALQPILDQARKESTQAIHQLIYVDADNTPVVRQLQTIARRYSDTVRWISVLQTEGAEALNKLAEMHAEGTLDVTPPIAQKHTEAEDMNDA